MAHVVRHIRTSLYIVWSACGLQFTFQLKLHNPNIKQWQPLWARNADADSLRWMEAPLCCDFGLAQKSTSCIFHQSGGDGGGERCGICVTQCLLPPPPIARSTKSLWRALFNISWVLAAIIKPNQPHWHFKLGYRI